MEDAGDCLEEQRDVVWREANANQRFFQLQEIFSSTGEVETGCRWGEGVQGRQAGVLLAESDGLPLVIPRGGMRGGGGGVEISKGDLLRQLPSLSLLFLLLLVTPSTTAVELVENVEISFAGELMSHSDVLQEIAANTRSQRLLLRIKCQGNELAKARRIEGMRTGGIAEGFEDSAGLQDSQENRRFPLLLCLLFLRRGGE